MEYDSTRSMLGEHGATRVRHWLPSCRQHGAFYIGFDPAGGVACQEGNAFLVGSLDTSTKNSHVTCDDVGRYTQGNLQAMLVKPIYNVCSYHLHRECCNTDF
jgi:hypothetical protein